LQVLSPPSQPTSKPAIGQHDGPMHDSLSLPHVDVESATDPSCCGVRRRRTRRETGGDSDEDGRAMNHRAAQ
jgi:hypothetical protein